MDLVDQAGIVSGEVSCVPGGSGGRGNAVIKRDVVKEVFAERAVGKQNLGKGVLRKRCRKHGVEVIVIRKPVVRGGILRKNGLWKQNVRNRRSLQNAAARRRSRGQC